MSSSVSFAYFGDFYGARSPAPFLEALGQIAAKTPELLNHMHVDFYGNIETKFVEMVEKSPVGIHRRKVTYFESLQYMAMTDVLLLIDTPSDSGVNPFLASKLIDYLGAGKRILGITDVKGTSADILRKYGHYVVSPHDTQGIVDAVKNCIAYFEISMNSAAEFATKNVVGCLVGMMTELISGGLPILNVD